MNGAASREGRGGTGGDGEVILRARGLVRRFGPLTAVDGCDLEVERGEVFGFLGPNGAGKSTLLRMLVGLLDPTAGEVAVLGLELPRQAERLRPRVGYMPQRFALYEDLTVEENLEFAAEIFGLGSGDRASRLEEVMAVYGLDDRRRQRAGELSGGWKQRLALAAATVHRPELLLLDEPTAGVDPENRRLFWEAIFELAEGGATVLVSTHYMDEAVRCHRLALLRHGRRVALGSPRELTASLARRVVSVESDRAAEAVRLLRSLPAVASVTQLGETAHVLLTREAGTAGDCAPRLVRDLAARGLSAAAAAAAPNLEDVFVAARRGEPLPGATTREAGGE